MRPRLHDLPRPAVAASLLAADFAHLADEIARVGDAGADLLHVDVMDGRFVPNLSMGPRVVETIRAATDLFLAVHLMVETPQWRRGRSLAAGATLIPMRSMRLVVADVDGTLLTQAKVITARVVAAVDALRRAGVKFTSSEGEGFARAIERYVLRGAPA